MNSSDSPLQPPLKNQKASEEGLCVGVDRISQLPDNVTCHILSFVTPTKHCIRTSVLSKRWQHLWALSPKLDLELRLGKIFNMYRELRANSFVRSVDNLFFLRDCLTIETFKLHVPIIDDLYSPERPSSWICAIVMCNIRELDIQIGRQGKLDLGELPWCLFTCKTLAVLKLSGSFILNVPHSVCLPNLKTLRFESVTYLDDAMFPKLLSGCPLLEDLQIVIYDWDPIWALTIYHSSLKRLYMHCHRGRNKQVIDRYKIIVDAPNLEFIELKVDLFDTLFKPLPNIDEAHVDFLDFDRVFDTSMSTYKMQALFESIVKVRRLFLSEETLNLHDLPIFCNLVQLDIRCTRTVFPSEIMDMLCHSPILEALCLRFMEICWDVAYEGIELENNVEDVPACLRHSLKTVQIHEFVGTDIELIVIKYLLENAVVLEKMTFSWRVPSMRIDYNLQRELENSPRLSTDCQLVFLSGSWGK